jgi:hypothetical protein
MTGSSETEEPVKSCVLAITDLLSQRNRIPYPNCKHVAKLINRGADKIKTYRLNFRLIV